ncbi:Metallo-dependent phosphatase [Byssothecium circinans]|uniref:Metallo-dependent phosphatase n=1 Tax=Byssothecium circinans TaxID=147558 RepID=A0A6A5U350_9PLEO|nr:Metallo-dependent phosphatase [Byssothecium circinans]
MAAQRQMRKTRIVCISDTHGQTPKLPKGDVLIHAGDLTNQGGFEELQKTAAWLEKADFEAKIVVAGNHDITLDAPFFREYGSSRPYPRPQDPDQCRKLFTESKSITYLENEAATIYLTDSQGPYTSFKVFGSPSTPKVSNWAFQYTPSEAPKLWSAIPPDTDIVVTHTPPKGHRDKATKDNRVGCEFLLNALHRVRPILAVCGHIHEARGVECVRWNDFLTSSRNGGLVKDVQGWEDPGAGEGNKKQSLVNLSVKGGRRLGNQGRLTCGGGTACGGQPDVPEILQPVPVLKSTSRPAVDNEARASGGTFEYQGSSGVDDIELREGDVDDIERKETVVINAAFLGPRIDRKTTHMNKPIVVDVDLPTWS